MNIYIDEAGSFIPTDRTNYVSCVAGLILGEGSHKCKQCRLPAREALHVEARLILGQSPYFEARGLDDLFGYNLRGRILELHVRVSL